MIAVNLCMGLGNKMFQYAFGRGLINKGYDIVFDVTNYTPYYPHESIQLDDVFPNIELPKMQEGNFPLLFPKKQRFPGYYRIKRFLKGCFLKEHYYFLSTHAYVPEIEKKIKNNIIFHGDWQTEKYFLHCKDDIRKQFTFPQFDEKDNIIIAKKMASENSVAIHVRKGEDYTNPLFVNICTLDYYKKAIDIIKHKVKDPIFYIFTDSPEWVKSNFPELEYTLINWNEGDKAFRDMQLMANAKHNIIANSTFSWWGAWLNPNPDKVVISPRIFFNPVRKYNRKTDIIPDSWIKV